MFVGFCIVFLKRQNALAFDIEWANDTFSRSDCTDVATGLKDKLHKSAPNCITMNDITILVRKNAKAKQLASKLLGCTYRCPLCGAKCQESTPLADDKHHTSYHFLQAFNGNQMNSKANKKRLPCIDVCNSIVNAQCGWFYDSAWSKMVRKINADWTKYEWAAIRDYFQDGYNWKIEPGLNETFVSTMLKSYFDSGLQNKLLKTTTFNLQNCVGGDKKKDVLCADQVRGFGKRKTRNKIVTHWKHHT